MPLKSAFFNGARNFLYLYCIDFNKVMWQKSTQVSFLHSKSVGSLAKIPLAHLFFVFLVKPSMRMVISPFNLLFSRVFINPAGVPLKNSS